MAEEDWRPSASIDRLRRRAEVLGKIRHFFAQRGVLEVDTPALAASTTADPAIASIEVSLHCRPGRRYFLQTSPEFAMKRLLAAGSGAIYQLGKVYRDDELGRLHQPEFTMLEWYRPGFDEHRLLEEIDDLLRFLGAHAMTRTTYQEAFERHAGVNPHTADSLALQAAIQTQGVTLSPSLNGAGRDVLLDVLMSHVVGPNLGKTGPQALVDYPASQAAYAQIKTGTPPVAARFEIFVAGVELANGYHEVTDATEQRQRFDDQNLARRALGLPEISLDERLLAALSCGLPGCAGVALGVDRLLMWLFGEASIEAVIPFDLDRA